ncbi:MAG: hypothetical protein HQ503_04145 [Rhodospirillales bacterium]|nr:hypothetical protein [Rhodospirillales bacterium]
MSAPLFGRLNVMWELPENWCEEQHLADILSHLEPQLVELGLAERFIFVMTSLGERIPMSHPERVIVFQTSDEGHEIPAYADDVFLVFKNYPPFDETPDNISVFPLGCNKDVPEIFPPAMTDRSLDIFFLGQKGFRDEFFIETKKAFSNDGSLAVDISAAPGFRKGLAPEDYASKLANTKIALSPRGVSHETFRIYEAMRAGCVLIAARQLPSWFTNGWPVIEVGDWEGIGPIARDLLNDADALQKLSDQTRAWWESHCSPAAIANFMMREIANRLLSRN